MGVVKYTGPVASFHCPTNAEIRSLKVHFSPKQLGEGDPSPENVRPIKGWNGVSVKQSGKNLFDANAEFFKGGDNRYYSKIIPNAVLCNVSFKLKNSSIDLSNVFFGFALDSNNIELGYNWVMRSGNIQSNKTNKAPGNKLCTYMTFYPNTMETFESLTQAYDIQIELGAETPYESYQGSTTNYEFGVLGKNKLSDKTNDYMHNYGSPTAKIVPDDFKFENGEFSGTVPEGIRDYCVHLGQIAYPPGTYTISCDYINNGQNYNWQPFVCSYSNINNWYIGLSGAAAAAAADSGHLERTFTATQPFYVNLTLNSNGNTTQIAENKIFNLQLELGSTATTYEPYDPNKTVYGGWVDLISGEVQEEMTRVIIDGTQTIQTRETYTNANVFRITKSRLPIESRGYHEDDMASYMMIATAANTANPQPWLFYMNTSSHALHFYFPKSYNLAAVQQYFQEHPLQCCYHITPITYSLAPTQLQTFLAQNNIWSNADYVEVEYDLHETQTILARKQFIIANQPHVVKPAAAPLQNFVTDMAAPLKECKVYFSPVQDTSNGVPSPDNICPISGWTGLEVTRCGKNFSTAATGTEMAQKWPINSGSSRELLFTGMKPGQELTLSASFTKASEPGSNKRLYLIGSQKTNSTTNSIFQGPSADGPRNVVIHNWVDTDGTIRITHNNRGLTYNDDFIEYAASLQNIQLELGDTATAFEPYSGTTIPIDWSSAGTIYGGYVDLVTGEVYATYRNVVLSTLSFELNSGRFLSRTGLSNAPAKNNSLLEVPNLYCDVYRTAAWYNGVVSSDYTAGVYGQQVMVGNPDYTTVADFKAAMAGKQFIYELATPQLVTTLTPTALRTLIGTNNIWADNNGSNVQIKFWTH